MNANAPGPSGTSPIRLGTVDATAGARVIMFGEKVVDAGLNPLNVPGDTMAATLPEPDALVQLLAGIAVLALLCAARRATVRASASGRAPS